MASATQNSPYSPSQIQAWLRGLLTVAWADGNFEASEKKIIQAMVDSEFSPNTDFDTLEPIEPIALAQELQLDAAQNFLRMAVMVALADGTYSDAENNQILAFAKALSIEPKALTSLQSALQDLRLLDRERSASANQTASQTASQIANQQTGDEKGSLSALYLSSLMPAIGKAVTQVDPLKPTRDWLDQLSIEDPRLARFVCKLIPSQCPFERNVTLFGRKVIHIPPMCKINPLYEQLVGLRFRALSYLADDCGEDVSSYV
jgi:tellurite resistance protein